MNKRFKTSLALCLFVFSQPIHANELTTVTIGNVTIKTQCAVSEIYKVESVNTPSYKGILGYKFDCFPEAKWTKFYFTPKNLEFATILPTPQYLSYSRGCTDSDSSHSLVKRNFFVSLESSKKGIPNELSTVISFNPACMNLTSVLSRELRSQIHLDYYPELGLSSDEWPISGIDGITRMFRLML